LDLRQSLECQLFESLVHHLIEKGVLTRNDALSVVQTVAQVTRGVLEEEQLEGSENELAILRRLYSSFELMSDRRLPARALDDGNVLQLRPPLHGDRPQFPEEY
jgi:hypothetical protein